MKHKLQKEGFGVRLRPVKLEDAAFIVWLRNLDRTKGTVGDSAADVASQENWLREYFEREGDYYFTVETLGGIPVGTVGVYDVSGSSGESGRWISRPEVPMAIASATLIHDLAFGELGLTYLRSGVVTTNEAVLALDLKLGYKQVRIEPDACIIGGRSVGMVHIALTPEDWAVSRQRLEPVARRTETKIRNWEKAQLETTGAHPKP